MKFIKFLLLHSQLQLSLEQVNILWDTLISKATPVEKTIGFQWFEKRCGNTSIFEVHSSSAVYVCIKYVQGRTEVLSVYFEGKVFFYRFFRIERERLFMLQKLFPVCECSGKTN
jgi:hypothetical protein